jgi:hypothetical protein
MKIRVYHTKCPSLDIDILSLTRDEAIENFGKILEKVSIANGFISIGTEIEEMEDTEYDALEEIEL